MKKYTSAGIVTFKKTNNIIHYLLLHYTAGHWDFPKGKLEANETPLEAAHRELKEETWLSAEIIPGFEDSFSYFYTDYDGKKAEKKVIYFIGKATNETIILSHEHKNYRWLTFDDARELVTFENAKELLTKANIFITTHYLKS